MSKYVDGFVLVVPKGKAEEYRKMADQGRDSWMKQKDRGTGTLSPFSTHAECCGRIEVYLTYP